MTNPNTPQTQQTPPQTQPPVATEPSTSGLAVAGLVLGIIAAATAFVPIINNISFFIALVGLALSIAGLVGINKGKHKGKGLAVAGIALGIVSLVAVLLMQAACSAMLSQSSGNSNAAPATNGAASQQASATAASSQQEADQPKYTVSIDDAVVSADYQGQPAIIVTYSWQNNSDDATSFAAALHPKCFQNGVQLDMAIGVEGEDSSGYLAEVKPGSGTTVQLSYELADQSPVEVEVSELISFSDEVLASKTFEIA